MGNESNEPMAWVPVDTILKMTQPFIVYFRVHEVELRDLQSRCSKMDQSSFPYRSWFWRFQENAAEIHNLAINSADGKILISSGDLKQLKRCTPGMVDDARRDLIKQVEHLAKMNADSVVADAKHAIALKYRSQKRLVAGVVLFVVGIAIVATRYVV